MPSRVWINWKRRQILYSRYVRPLLNISQGYAKVSQRIHSTFKKSNQLITGGIVLWSRSFTPTNDRFGSAASPVNSLIRDVLIEGRSAENHYEKDGYAIRWSFVNDLELIFVVCILLATG